MEIELELLMLFGLGGDVGVLFREDRDDARDSFAVDCDLVVLAYDVDVELLGWEVSGPK
jgi:hypothetical protein